MSVILTGMGEDGREGVRVLRTYGGQTLTQDAASSRSLRNAESCRTGEVERRKRSARRLSDTNSRTRAKAKR